MPLPKTDIETAEPGTSSPGSSKDSFDRGTRHHENADRLDSATRQASVAALLRNPLAGKTEEEVLSDVDAWVEEKGLVDHRETFRKGALIARVGQREDGFEYVSQLSEDDKNVLRHENSHRWDQ